MDNSIIKALIGNKLNEDMGILWYSDERKKKLRNTITALIELSKTNGLDIDKFLKFLLRILRTYEGKEDSKWLKDLPQIDTVKDINKNIDVIIKELQAKSRLKIRILFSDIDGTLIHKEKSDIRIADEGKFVSKKTIKLIAKIMQFVPVVLISGRRLLNFKKITHRIPYTFGVIEHGCIIVKEGKIDFGYLEKMRPCIGYPEKGQKEGQIWDYEKRLNQMGYKTDSEGRLASFRIDSKQSNLTEEQIQKIEKMQHPAGIKTVRNESFLDFIPSAGGKDNAIQFLMDTIGLGWGDVACMGDDLNDLDMLSRAGYPFTLSGAKKEIIDIVKKRGGYISPLVSHNGAEDILMKIYGMFR